MEDYKEYLVYMDGSSVAMPCDSMAEALAYAKTQFHPDDPEWHQGKTFEDCVKIAIRTVVFQKGFNIHDTGNYWKEQGF